MDAANLFMVVMVFPAGTQIFSLSKIAPLRAETFSLLKSSLTGNSHLKLLEYINQFLIRPLQPLLSIFGSSTLLFGKEHLFVIFAHYCILTQEIL